MTPTLAGTPLLAGAELVSRIRRLLIVSLVTAAAYSIAAGASAGFCPGGFDGRGGFLDADGRPTDIAPSCIQLTMTPNPLLLLAAGVLIIHTLTRVLHRAESMQAALRTLDRMTIGIGLGFVVAIVVAQAWFWLHPVTDWTGGSSYSVLAPFPFASVTIDISPMTAG